MGRSSVHAAAVVVAIFLALSASTALAQVSSGDATATRIYLQEHYAATRAEVKDFSVAIAAVDALGKQLQTECPGVLANAPTPAQGAKLSSSETEIDEEETATVFGVAEHTEYPRRRSFARAVSGLRWSNGALTRLVHAYAAAEVAHAEVPPPDLCADLRTWVSSGYQTVSAGTETYLHREAVLSQETDGVEEVIARKLTRYENQADRRIARQIASLEKSTTPTFLNRFLAALGKITEVLDAPPAAPAT
ncbi:MAG: hypothetical protein ACLQBY_04260 [Solirubrobacteraceae bacterium]